MQFSEKLMQLEESATLAIAKQVRLLKAQGKDIVSLTLGEPDFDTPLHIREAAKQALDAGFTHYPPVDGLQELRAAIVEKFRRDNGLEYSLDNIMVSTGAKQAIYNAIFALLNPGDEVVIPAPYWVSYSSMVELADGVVRLVQTELENNYKITPEQLDAAITPRTKVFMFTSPSNPTGSMYSRDEIQALVAVLEKHPQVFIIADEIYEHIAYEQQHISIASFPSMFERTVTVNGFSKAYAMTGWRLGYIGAPKTVKMLCEKMQGQCTSGTNAFAMKGAVAALTGDQQCVKDMTATFRRRRDLMYALLSGIDGLKVNLPDGAFYFYPDISAFLGSTAPDGSRILTPADLGVYLVGEGVAIVNGEAFGTNKHIRLSYASDEATLQVAAERMRNGLNKLQRVPELIMG